MTYSSKVRELVARLPNAGDLPAATHIASEENPVCGDRLTLFLRIEQGSIVDCSFRAEGCPAALAGAAGLTELVRGGSVEEASAIDTARLLEHLDGLPSHKRHGAELAVIALRAALGGNLR